MKEAIRIAPPTPRHQAIRSGSSGASPELPTPPATASPLSKFLPTKLLSHLNWVHLNWANLNCPFNSPQSCFLGTFRLLRSDRSRPSIGAARRAEICGDRPSSSDATGSGCPALPR